MLQVNCKWQTIAFLYVNFYNDTKDFIKKTAEETPFPTHIKMVFVRKHVSLRDCNLMVNVEVCKHTHLVIIPLLLRPLSSGTAVHCP